MIQRGEDLVWMIKALRDPFHIDGVDGLRWDFALLHLEQNGKMNWDVLKT